MKIIHNLTYLGLFFNTLIILYTAFSERFSIFLIPVLIALSLCFVGVFLITMRKLKLGSMLFYVGIFLFIALAVIGIIDVNKTIQNLEQQ